MKLVTPEKMAMMDNRTIDEIGIPGVVLMERAAAGAVAFLKSRVRLSATGKVVVLCGGGNNGGDGIAMARMLFNEGVDVEIILLSEPDKISGEAGTNLDVAKNLKIPLFDWSDYSDDDIERGFGKRTDAGLWIDALLGTGIDRPVEGKYRKVVEFLNGHNSPVFSLDIPSGVNGTTGQRLGAAVRADWTATFGLPKIGHALYPGRRLTGELDVVGIGIPTSVESDVGAEAEWLNEEWAKGQLKKRPDVYHKGTAGRLLILAGSLDKGGAAFLTTRGARSAGAGLITVGTWGDVVPSVAANVNEAMAKEVFGVDDGSLEEALDETDSIAMGPGMGLGPGVLPVLEKVLRSDLHRVVFDADALTLLAREELIKDRLPEFARKRVVVLTPHPGEMARLIDEPVDNILANPIQKATELATQTNTYVVLKGAATVVAAPGGRTAVNRSGNPGMASGGMGDVLTGIIGARLAERSESPWNAICSAVFAHGKAGDRAARQKSERGISATDLVESLSGLWGELTDTDR